MLRKILEFIPVISITIFLINFAYLHSYFSHFEIEILNYIDYSEVLISTSSWIVNFLVVIPALAFSFVKLDKMGELLIMGKKKVTEVITVILSVLILILILTKIFLLEFQLIKNYIPEVVSLIIFFFMILFIIDITQKKGNDKSNRFLFLLIVFMFTTAVFNSAFYGRVKAYFIQTGYKQVANVSFIYNGSKVKSNDSLIFIGMTKSSLFLFNKSECRTYLYPQNNVFDFSITH